MTKVTYDSRTICAKCRRQECSIDLTCDECVGWDEKKWKVLRSYLDKLDRDRKWKAAIRVESRAQSVEPVTNIQLIDRNIPSPAFALFPILSPPNNSPSTLVHGSHASDPGTVASLESKVNRKFNLVVNTVSKLGELLKGLGLMALV